MSKRRCAATNCPNLTPTGRTYCPQHARERDKARGTPAERGYGRGYRRARRTIAPMVAAGKAVCWRCKQPIAAGEPWDLGHDDNDRTIIRGPEHATCNRRAAGHAAHPGSVR